MYVKGLPSAYQFICGQPIHGDEGGSGFPSISAVLWPVSNTSFCVSPLLFTQTSLMKASFGLRRFGFSGAGFASAFPRKAIRAVGIDTSASNLPRMSDAAGRSRVRQR